MRKKKKRHSKRANILATRDGVSNPKQEKGLRKAKVRKYKLLQENFSPEAWAALLIAFDVVPFEQIHRIVAAEPAVAVELIEQLKITEIEIATVGIKVTRDA